MESTAPPRNRDGFKIAIICALPEEAAKVRSVFDRCWEDEGKQYGKAIGDKNEYTTGAIGKHNVVMPHMGKMGATEAAAVVANLYSSFNGIQLALVVGICGVVPTHPTTQKEIVLGDIVISTSMVQYDFGRQYHDGFQIKKGVEDSLRRATREIQSFIRKLQVPQNRKRLTTNLVQLLQSARFKDGVSDCDYPGATRDRLYEASYHHRHRRDVSCIQCNNNTEICSKTCDELGCEEDRLIIRNRHSFPKTKELALLPNDAPFIHLGKYGSANTVMKSAVDRDRIASAEEVVAFEMEGAGVWDQHSTIVIKAACDYADSHKSKEWQPYAATIAAACLKVFLNEWSKPDQLVDEDEIPAPVCNIPFEHLPGFVGRALELESLKRKIFDSQARRVVPILGLGGIGKSRLAMELAHQIQCKDPEYSIYWIEASTQLTFERDVLEIAIKLGIPGIEMDKADIKNLFKQRLSNSIGERWLLVLDNADDEALWGRQRTNDQETSSLVQYLPKTASGSIVITTRAPQVANFLASKEVIGLGEVSSEEGVRIFTEAMRKPDLAVDSAAVSALIEKLAYLPLAIIQAASFINMTGRSIQFYLHLLDRSESEVIKLLSKDFGDQTRYPDAKNPIATTWLISFNQIQEHHDLAATFLSYMACLHEKNIPRSLLPKTDSEIDALNAIDILKGYSFIRQQSRHEGSTELDELYDLHRLVQLAARNWLEKEGSLLKWTKICLDRVIDIFPEPEHQYKNIWTIYLPHAQRVCDDNVNNFPERYFLLQQIGHCFLRDGKYSEAVKIYSAIQNWAEKTIGPLDKFTLASYNYLGEAFVRNGDFHAAELLLEKALSRWNEVHGAEHPNTLTSMSSLANTYSNQGQYDKAETLHVQVLEACKRVLGPEHPETLTSINNLANTYSNQGRYDKAETLYIQVLEASKGVLGAEHPETLISMNNLATTYSNRGRFDEAEKLHVQVLEAGKRALGSKHPETLISMNNLATTYLVQGRYDKAEDLHLHVLQTSKRVLGAEHPITLISLSRLASIYWAQRQYEGAEVLEKQVLEASKRTLGAEHPNTLTSMSSLACTLRAQGKGDEAKRLMSSCLELSVNVLGSEHPVTLGRRNILNKWSGLEDAEEDELEEGMKKMPGAWYD